MKTDVGMAVVGIMDVDPFKMLRGLSELMEQRYALANAYLEANSSDDREIIAEALRNVDQYIFDFLNLTCDESTKRIAVQ